MSTPMPMPMDAPKTPPAARCEHRPCRDAAVAFRRLPRQWARRFRTTTRDGDGFVAALCAKHSYAFNWSDEVPRPSV
jgi:hypothetical protein